MLKVYYAPPFVRQVKKLPPNLQEEVFEKIDLFIQNYQNPILKTHKLKGKLKDRFSFSVNYKNRIVFQFISTDEVIFLAVGNHDVYKI